jgi:hypothetical protein
MRCENETQKGTYFAERHYHQNYLIEYILVYNIEEIQKDKN